MEVLVRLEPVIIDPHDQPHSHSILVYAVYWCIYLLGVIAQLVTGRSLHEMALGFISCLFVI